MRTVQLAAVTLGIAIALLCFPPLALAAPSAPAEVTTFATTALSLITVIGSAAAVFFLIRGGFLYITSTGKPEALDDAKQTIRNALVGLVLLLAASAFVSTLSGALNGDVAGGGSALPITQIETVAPTGGLTQVLIDAVNGFVQNIVESATKPVVDGILTFVATTPSLIENTTIVQFWLVMVGITDVLFVLVIAVLGLQLMSATTFGFEQVELKQLLPKIGVAFLAANTSLFLADYAIQFCNALVKGVLSATGGLNHAWVSNAVNVTSLAVGGTPIIVLIFMLIFLIVAIMLLLFYIGRLIIISLGAVLAPFIFLLWVVPKTAEFAQLCVKGYFVAVFTVFIHVVTIQLAGSFLTLPEQTHNSLISIAVAIGLVLTLLKSPAFMMQLMTVSGQANTVKRMGSQIVNVMSADKARAASTSTNTAAVTTARRVVRL